MNTLCSFNNQQNCVRTYCIYQPSFKVIRTRSKTRCAHPVGEWRYGVDKPHKNARNDRIET